MAAILGGYLQVVGVPLATHLVLTLGDVAGTLRPAVFGVGGVP